MLTKDTVAVEMVPCATYAIRSAEWIPAFDGLPAHLVIRLQRKAGCKEHAAVYGVRELPSDGSAREFELTKTTGRQRVTYICVIGREMSCTCRAGECKEELCKHRSALQCLLATGEV